MKKLVSSATIAVVLLGCQAKTPRPGETDTRTLQGCISKESSGYVLSDDSGRRYELSGNLSGLDQAVGKQALVRGQMLQAAAEPGAPAAASDGIHNRISIFSMQLARGACKPGAH
jgi:hypothetical protein